MNKKEKDEYDYIYDPDDMEYSEYDDEEDIESEIDSLRGTISSGDCIYCHGKNTMTFAGNCFVCSKCGNSINEDSYYRWAAGYPIEIVDDLGRPYCDPSYEDIYDAEGDIALVQCNNCEDKIRWKDGEYICPNCGSVMNRAELFNCIGVEPLGPECLTCGNLYPGCAVCPYGYVD